MNKNIWILGLLFILSIRIISAVMIDDFNKPDGVIDYSSTNNLGSNYFGTSLSGCNYLNGEAYCSDGSAKYYNYFAVSSGESIEFDAKCSSTICWIHFIDNSSGTIIIHVSMDSVIIFEGSIITPISRTNYYHIKLELNGTSVNAYLNGIYQGTFETYNRIPVNNINIYSFQSLAGGNSLYLDNLETTGSCVENWLPRLEPTICESGIQVLKYYDTNNCGTDELLPTNPLNGSIQTCCVENWKASLSRCIEGIQQLTYTDKNSCGTAYSLPLNNNTYSECRVCIENWERIIYPLTCLNGTQLITYIDKNKCNTTTYLPIDNGTTRTCCFEEWVMNLEPEICESGKQTRIYTDSNECGTIDRLPKNNGTTQKCKR